MAKKVWELDDWNGTTDDATYFEPWENGGKRVMSLKEAEAYLNRLEAASEALKQAEEALAEAHQLLDARNADLEMGNCHYCAGEGYDGNGLVHLDSCVIVKARAALSRIAEGGHGA